LHGGKDSLTAQLFCVFITSSSAERRRSRIGGFHYRRSCCPYLPKVIHGPLFVGGTLAASKQLNKFIRRIGIACDTGHKTDCEPPVAPSITVGRCLATK